MTRSTLSLSFKIIDGKDPHPQRNLSLKSPSYSIRIGRGSRSGALELIPSEENAYFDSRVMSREHAVLNADPLTKTLLLKDCSSMHGTYVNDKAVPLRGQTLQPEDLVRFGTEVSRGPDSYSPLKVMVTFSWVDDSPTSFARAYGLSSYRPPPYPTFLSRNSFSVPEIPDQDNDSDIEIVEESMRVIPAKPIIIDGATRMRLSVPGSDVSCAGSFSSEDSHIEPHTPETSALEADTSLKRRPSGLTEAEKQEDEIMLASMNAAVTDQAHSKITSVAVAVKALANASFNDNLEAAKPDMRAKTGPLAVLRIRSGSLDPFIPPKPLNRTLDEQNTSDIDLTQSELDDESESDEDIYQDDNSQEQDEEDPEEADFEDMYAAEALRDNLHTLSPADLSQLYPRKIRDDTGIVTLKVKTTLDGDGQPAKANEEARKDSQTSDEHAMPAPAPGKASLAELLLPSVAPVPNTVRAPSPSDAAMAKPSEPARSAPFGDAIASCGGSSFDFTQPYPASFLPYTMHTTYTDNPFNEQMSAGYNAPASMYTEGPFSMIDRQPSPELHYSTEQDIYARLDDDEYDFGLESEPNGIRWARNTGVEAEILDVHSTRYDAPPPSSPIACRKRKAHKIDDDDFESHPVVQPSLPATEVWPTTNEKPETLMVVKTVADKTDNIVADLAAAIKEPLELVPAITATGVATTTRDVAPPAKRLRTKSSVASLAAAAAAGIVVGSAGTIAALVSLPAGYFA